MDKRYQKTEIRLNQALWELIAQNGVLNLHLKDILTTANISKSVFYAHYKNMDDLLRTQERALITGMELSTLPVSFFQLAHHDQTAQQELRAHIQRMVDYVYANGEKFYLLLNGGGDPTFEYQLHHLVASHPDPQSVPALKYFYTGMLGMITNIIVLWGRNHFEDSPNQIANLLFSIIQPILSNN